jgi:hypothetical protein
VTDTAEVARTAERIILGAAMTAPEMAETLAGIVTAESFERPAHRAIWAAIRTLRDRDDPAEPMRVGAALLASGDLAKAGGAAYLTACVEAVPVLASAPTYAREVAVRAQQRHLVARAARLTEATRIEDPEVRAASVAEIVAEIAATAVPAASEGDSWAPVDLGPYLAGEVKRPEPTVGLARSDGLQLLYPGKEHSVIGEMEAGKSWVALACAAAELADGNPVVYIHFEESDPSDSVERLQALGVRDNDILKLFRFVGPDRPVTPDRLARLLDPPPSLVILDGVNEAMSLHGQAIREEDGAAAFRSRLVKPCIKVGAATVSLDHVVKDPERRGRGPLGSIHKGNALSGVLIMLENAEPFGREQKGRSHVFVTKDRPGHLRRHGRPTKTPGKTFMGELVVDDTRRFNPWLELKFWAPADREEETAPEGDTGDASELAESVLQVVAAQPERAVTSERKLLAALRLAGHKARNTEVRTAVDDLCAARRLEEFPGPRNATGYRVPTASQDPAQTPS